MIVPHIPHKYNMSVNNTTLYFIYNKNSILSGWHVSTFIRSSSGPLRKQIQELSIFQCIVGSQMLTDYVYWNRCLHNILKVWIFMFLYRLMVLAWPAINLMFSIPNTTRHSITQHFILYTIKTVYCQGDMFRPLLGHIKLNCCVIEWHACIYIITLWDGKH